MHKISSESHKYCVKMRVRGLEAQFHLDPSHLRHRSGAGPCRGRGGYRWNLAGGFARQAEARGHTSGRGEGGGGLRRPPRQPGRAERVSAGQGTAGGVACADDRRRLHRRHGGPDDAGRPPPARPSWRAAVESQAEPLGEGQCGTELRPGARIGGPATGIARARHPRPHGRPVVGRFDGSPDPIVAPASLTRTARIGSRSRTGIGPRTRIRTSSGTAAAGSRAGTGT